MRLAASQPPATASANDGSHRWGDFIGFLRRLLDGAEVSAEMQTALADGRVEYAWAADQ
jgi:hypothetical protein